MSRTNLEIPLLSVSIAVAIDIEAYIALDYDGTLPALGGKILGITQRPVTANTQPVACNNYGLISATSGVASLPVGTLLMVNTAGKMIPWTTGNTAVGRVYTAASAVDDIFTMFYIPH